MRSNTVAAEFKTVGVSKYQIVIRVIAPADYVPSMDGQIALGNNLPI